MADKPRELIPGDIFRDSVGDYGLVVDNVEENRHIIVWFLSTKEDNTQAVTSNNALVPFVTTNDVEFLLHLDWETLNNVFSKDD